MCNRHGLSIFSQISQGIEVEVDATTWKTCADATGEKGGEANTIECSKGGLTTKVHAAVEVLGLPVRFAITPGQWG